MVTFYESDSFDDDDDSLNPIKKISIILPIDNEVSQFAVFSHPYRQPKLIHMEDEDKTCEIALLSQVDSSNAYYMNRENYNSSNIYVFEALRFLEYVENKMDLFLNGQLELEEELNRIKQCKSSVALLYENVKEFNSSIFRFVINNANVFSSKALGDCSLLNFSGFRNNWKTIFGEDLLDNPEENNEK